MKSKDSRRIRILEMLEYKKLSCQDITKRLIAEDNLTGSVAHYLSGSISSILNKLVKQGILKYATEKGPRGGYIYEKF